MRGTLLADRYAQALREAVTKPAQLEKVAETLNLLSAMYTSNVDFRRAMINPVLNMDERRTVLDVTLKALQAPPEAARLLRTMLDRNRMTLLPLLASRFESHINEWLNRVEVTIVTAVPLNDELKARVVKSLEEFSGKTVQLRCKVDLNIIGGLIVYMWGVFFDLSLRTRLERLRQILLAEETLTYGH